MSEVRGEVGVGDEVAVRTRVARRARRGVVCILDEEGLVGWGKERVYLIGGGVFGISEVLFYGMRWVVKYTYTHTRSRELTNKQAEYPEASASVLRCIHDILHGSYLPSRTHEFTWHGH